MPILEQNNSIRIEVQDLHFGFDQNLFLKGVDLKLYDGEILVLLGRNGCGKTVLLKMLDALIQPLSGSIVIDGVSLLDLENKELNDIRRKIGFVFQRSGLFDSMSVGENVSFGLKRFEKQLSDQQVDEKVDAILAQVGLPNTSQKLPSELSGGMQKRAGLARALIQDPQIILYDDPSAGLDPVLTDAIAYLIKQTRDRTKSTALVVTHDLVFAAKIASRVCLLYNGKILGPWPWDEFQKSDEPIVKQYREGNLQGPISLIE